MKRDQLTAMAPTAQVRTLAMEFLKDGEIHSRREIVEYVLEQGKLNRLPPFREGHLAGGVREAVTDLKCEKIGRGMFQAPQSHTEGLAADSEDSVEETDKALSCMQKAIIICNEASDRLAEVALEINYATADDREANMLMRLREYVRLLRKFGDE